MTKHIMYADGKDDHLTHEEIINMLNTESEQGHHLWTFVKVLNPCQTKIYGKQTMEVEVLIGTQGRKLGNHLM